MQLSADAVEVTALRPHRIVPKQPQPREVLRVPLALIAGVKLGHVWQPEEASEIGVELQFSEKTIFGESVVFFTQPRVALTLVNWLEQVKMDNK